MTVRLSSTPLFHTPGILMHARQMYATGGADRDIALNILSSYPGIQLVLALAFLRGLINFTLDEDVAVFEYDPEALANEVAEKYRRPVEDEAVPA